MRNSIKTFKQNQGGFTLIEIAIVMAIVGVIVTSFLHLYTVYNVKTRMEDTETSRHRIVAALGEYKRINGSYPCPARYDASLTDPKYGIAGDCKDLSVVAGACAQGICVENSERTVTLADGTVVTPRVRRGSLPFRTMGIKEDLAYDAYGGRFNYAVTELLTDYKTFDSGYGGISVVDNKMPTPNSLVNPPGSALYFLFSSGPDNVGAYDYSGKLISECNGTMLDNENCNTSVLYPLAVYRDAPTSTVPTDALNAGILVPGGPPASLNVNTHFDDFTSFVANEEEPRWRLSDADKNNAHDLSEPNEVVKFGEPPTDNSANLKVNVEGEARAADKVIVDDVCNSNDADCFKPEDLATVGMMDCATTPTQTGKPGTGVGSRKIKCGELNTLTVTCGPGEFVAGFDGGEPVCRELERPEDCPAITRNLCNPPVRVTRTQPITPSGGAFTITAGASASRTWTCNNGTWDQGPQTGVCTCNAGSVTTAPQACGAAYGNNTYTTTTTTVCPAGTTTTTDTRATTCICVPYTRTRNQNCPGNLTGNIAQTSNVTCVNNAPVNGPWVDVPGGNTCTCALPATDVETEDCPNGQDGEITITRPLNATTCTYGAETVTNNCTCNPRDPQTRSRQCPSPTTGVYQQQRLFQCPAGTWGGWTDLPNSRETNCSCVNRTETRFVESCTAPQTGGHNEERTVDCYGAPVSGSAGQWTMVGTQNCQSPPPPPVCTLSKKSNALGSSTTSSPAPGGVCACGSPDRSCYEAAGGGQYDRYTCECI